MANNFKYSIFLILFRNYKKVHREIFLVKSKQ